MADLPSLPSDGDIRVPPPRRPEGALKRRLRALDLRPAHGVMLALAIAILVVAVFIGRSLADISGTSSGSQVPSGDIALSDWVVWKSAKTPATFRPLLPDATAVRPVGVAGVTVVTSDIGPDGVPQLLSGLKLSEVQRRQLASGRVRANVYTAPLTAHPTVKATLLLSPTRTGVTATACLANVSDSGLEGNDCLTLLTTYIQTHGIALAGDRVDSEQVKKFTELIAAFGAARQRDSNALDDAATSGRQANAARRLSDGYNAVSQVAAGISYSTLARASGEELAQALSDGSEAYGALAQAADDRSAAEFTAAREDAVAANARIQAAVQQLGALGYAGS